MSTHTARPARYPDAVTEYVAAHMFATYRRNARRMGLVIILSSPSNRGGYWVTTAARRGSVAR